MTSISTTLDLHGDRDDATGIEKALDVAGIGRRDYVTGRSYQGDMSVDDV
jgi:hypothetical protein